MAACAALVLARRRGAARAGHSSTGRCHQRGSHEAAAEDLRAAVVQHIEGVHVQISGRRRGRTAADRPHSGPTLRLLTVRTASSVCLILSNLAAQHGRACEVQNAFTGSLICDACSR